MAGLTFIEGKPPHKYAVDGLLFANSAIEFAGLAWEGEKHGLIASRLHLYAIAIELAFKSAALRSGADIQQCKAVSHSITKQVELVENYGITVPDDLKRRLCNDNWFHKLFFMTRYPSVLRETANFENTLFIHSNYPEMISIVLELPCDSPLSFEKGSALNEIHNKFAYALEFKEKAERIYGRRKRFD